MILHHIYNFLWTIAPPILRYYLRKRAKKNSDYSLYWDERFGVPYSNPVKNAVWIHAVSVGETRAALPLINELQKRLPETSFLITQTTPTGRKTAQQLFVNAQCRYLPYEASCLRLFSSILAKCRFQLSFILLKSGPPTFELLLLEDDDDFLTVL